MPQVVFAANNTVNVLNVSIDKNTIDNKIVANKIIIETSDLVDYSISEGESSLIVNLNNAKISSKVKTKINNMIADVGLIKEIKVDKITKNSSMVNVSLNKDIKKINYNITTIPKNSKTKKGFCIVILLEENNNSFDFSPCIKGKVIVVDPGHGGSDPGAIGPTGIKEKDVNFAVAKQVEKILKSVGAKVVLTRYDDVDVCRPNASASEELRARVNVGIRNNADVFISIHSNSFSNEKAEGTATYYYSKSYKDELLAKNIQSGMIEFGKRDDRGIVDTNFYVTKRSPMPAALMELAFISNYEEEELLNSVDFQKNMALGICKGINNYFLKTK